MWCARGHVVRAWPAYREPVESGRPHDNVEAVWTVDARAGQKKKDVFKGKTNGSVCETTIAKQ